MAFHPIDVHVGERMRDCRLARGLTQTQVATAVGFTFQQLQKYESGRNRISASRLYDCAMVLKVEPSHFYDEVSPKTKAAAARLRRFAAERQSKIVEKKRQSAAHATGRKMRRSRTGFHHTGRGRAQPEMRP